MHRGDATPRSAEASGRVLVLGATGQQGRAVVAALLAHNRPVRAFVRDRRSASASSLRHLGVDLAEGSFTDLGSLRRAMAGTGGVFAMTTPFEEGPDAEIRQGMAIIAAAEQTSVPFLVYSSVAGALQATGVPHFDSKAEIERELARRGVPAAVLAPTFFYDNLGGQLRSICLGMADELSLPMPAARRLQQIDHGSYGAAVAAVLRHPTPWIDRRFEIASDSVSGLDMTNTLAQL